MVILRKIKILSYWNWPRNRYQCISHVFGDGEVPRNKSRQRCICL